MPRKMILTEVLRELIERAFKGQSIPQGPHPLDDEETQTCIEHDLLSPDERRKIINHLAICPQCRGKIACLARIDAGDTTQ